MGYASSVENLRQDIPIPGIAFSVCENRESRWLSALVAVPGCLLSQVLRRQQRLPFVGRQPVASLSDREKRRPKGHLSGEESKRTAADR